MDLRRIKQVCHYGWKDASELSKEDGVKKGRTAIFLDILHCFFKYNVWSNQYKNENLHLLSSEQKREICLKYQEKNTKRDRWVKEFFDNYKFLNKWSSFKYEQSAELQAKRHAAYKKQYGLGENCFVGYDVIINRHHYSDETIIVGINCHIAEQCVIDYTGGLKLGEKVILSENVKILTHNHPMDFSGKESLQKGMTKTPLVIGDYVGFGARAIVLPGVKEIGRGASIAAGAVIKRQVPPYAIVMGNPARIVGFRMTPAQIVEFEKEKYEEKDRLPLELLESNYEKYFLSRVKEIQQFLV